MKHTFKLSALTLALLSSINTHAQEASGSGADNDDEIEIIEITGFKGSIQKSLNSKRFSDSVSDSIHAEDVGKSTDQNIADALSRVTGVTV